MADLFRVHVVQNVDAGAPVVLLGTWTFLWIRHANVYVVAVTASNANPTMVFEFLHKFVDTSETYVGEVLDDESVKKNYVLLYELLNEMLDFGYPQVTELSALKMLVTSESVRGAATSAERRRPPSGVYADVPTWRRRDIKYRKNKCFVDVVETLHLLISAQGKVLRADVDERVMMRSYLSGMPVCRLGLNSEVSGTQANEAAGVPSSVALDEVALHPCVQVLLRGQGSDMHFVPPDGEFELMRYRATKNIRVPLHVRVFVEELATREIRYHVQLQTNMDPQIQATNVEVRIPTPPHATHAACTAQTGGAAWHPDDDRIVWVVPRVQGASESSLHATVTLASKQAWTRRPIEVDFDLLMFAASGLTIRYLTVSECSGYRPVKWVRYHTKAQHSYVVRF